MKDLTIQEWCKYISDWRDRKGFHTPKTICDSDSDNMLGKLMLVVTEIAEAAEAVRHYNLMNFKEELADATIRIFDICGTVGIDLEEEIDEKMRVNEQRPTRHGKKTSL